MEREKFMKYYPTKSDHINTMIPNNSDFLGNFFIGFFELTMYYGPTSSFKKQNKIRKVV